MSLDRHQEATADVHPRLRVSAFVLVRGRILLVRQRKGKRSYWLLPGGGVERGEPLHEAVARELREECSLVGRTHRPPLGMVETISPDRGVSKHVVHVIYKTDVSPTQDAATPPEYESQVPGRSRGRDPAVVEMNWFNAHELDDLIIHPPVHDMLHYWIAWFEYRGATRPEGVGDRGILPPFFDAGPRWTD